MKLNRESLLYIDEPIQYTDKQQKNVCMMSIVFECINSGEEGGEDELEESEV